MTARIPFPGDGPADATPSPDAWSHGNAGPIDLCGIALAHPIINGSGTFDAIAARRVFGDALDATFPFSAYVSKTITLAPRQGNPPPRLWEQPAGLLNSIGLPNRGLDGFIEHDLPRLAALPVPLIVSVMGFSIGELRTLVERVGARAEVAAIELNFSCPNVESGRVIGSDPRETAAAVAALAAISERPLIVKLTPNAADPAEVAVAAESAGAGAVSLINTLKGMAFAPGTSRPWLGAGTGGVSGPSVRAVALAQVAAVAAKTGVPVIGMGGVESGEHARNLMAAGAAVVAVGTANFTDPRAGARVAAELCAEPRVAPVA